MTDMIGSGADDDAHIYAPSKRASAVASNELCRSFNAAATLNSIQPPPKRLSSRASSTGSGTRGRRRASQRSTETTLTPRTGSSRSSHMSSDSSLLSDSRSRGLRDSSARNSLMSSASDMFVEIDKVPEGIYVETSPFQYTAPQDVVHHTDPTMKGANTRSASMCSPGEGRADIGGGRGGLLGHPPSPLRERRRHKSSSSMPPVHLTPVTGDAGRASTMSRSHPVMGVVGPDDTGSSSPPSTRPSRKDRHGMFLAQQQQQGNGSSGGLDENTRTEGTGGGRGRGSGRLNPLSSSVNSQIHAVDDDKNEKRTGGGGGASASASAGGKAMARRGRQSIVEATPIKGFESESRRAFNARQLQLLGTQGFTTGLAKALLDNATMFDHRFWIIDNSGSMQIGDGHRIVPKKSGSGSKLKGKKCLGFNSVPCTRWEEIQDAVRYHAQMAALLNSPTIFKFLNDPGCRVGPQQFSVADKGEEKAEEDVQRVFELMRTVKPDGVTPLTEHLMEIHDSVRRISPELKRIGKKVVVIVATDGLPTDAQGFGGEEVTRQFMDALRLLEGLPVWVVFRLCTDEDDVTEFYNSLDRQLEVSLEVLDDFVSESKEVLKFNKWLNYALPVHRCRELGYHDRLFDFVDERTLTKGEVREFCCLLFGVEDNYEKMPDPGSDWVGFLKTIQRLLKSEQDQWNPVKKKMMPWIDLRALNEMYGDKKSRDCTIS